MSESLFTVESTFEVRGHGIVLLPGISLAQYESIKVGDLLTINRPDGSLIRTEVRGVEYPPSVKRTGEQPASPRYGVLVDASDVPAGSIVTAE